MKYRVFITLTACFLWVCSDGAKILVFCPIPAPSHHKMYKEVWKELALRGHEVHVVTPNPDFNSSMKNIVEYDISAMHDFEKNQIKPEWKAAFFRKPSFIGTIIRQVIMQQIAGNGMELLYNHPAVKALVKEHQHFDACVLEWYHPAIAVYGHLFNCSIIGLGSNTLPIQMLDTVGNPSDPIIAPEQDLPFVRDNLPLQHRMWSAFWAVFVRIHQHFFLIPTEDSRIKRHYGKDVPYLGELQKNISLILLNRNPAFHRPMPKLPAIVELGAISYRRPSLTIDPVLKKFLDEGFEGVVYFSLGISMDGSSMPVEYIQKFQGAFKKLPYKVVWKWEARTMPNKPANIFISKYLPQVDVLEHPNVKLFITQGGLQSIEETIVAHKPIIGIPFHSDQTTNVDTCVKHGIGKMLDLEDITEENLRNYILEIVNNASYVENVKKLDQLMKDQPQDGLQKAVWWVEYVIRHKGAKHLRSVAADMPLWQYLMLDVMGVILGAVSIVVFSFYFAMKGLIKLIALGLRGRQGKKKKD